MFWRHRDVTHASFIAPACVAPPSCRPKLLRMPSISFYLAWSPMSVLEQGFSAAASWLADDFVRKGLIEGNQESASDFLWMNNVLDFYDFGEIGARLGWACLGLFCGVPMVLLQYLYAAVAQVVYDG